MTWSFHLKVRLGPVKLFYHRHFLLKCLYLCDARIILVNSHVCVWYGYRSASVSMILFDGISALLLMCGIFCFSYQYYWSNKLYLKFPCNGIHIQYWITGISVTIVIHEYFPWYTWNKWTKRKKKCTCLTAFCFNTSTYINSIYHYVTKLSVSGGRSVYCGGTRDAQRKPPLFRMFLTNIIT